VLDVKGREMTDTEISNITTSSTDNSTAWMDCLQTIHGGRELVKKVITRKFENGELVEERIEEEWESVSKEYVPVYPYYPRYPTYPTYPTYPYYPVTISWVSS
jgi:hypothetical protein